jgi:hypothetical protein
MDEGGHEHRRGAQQRLDRLELAEPAAGVDVTVARPSARTSVEIAGAWVWAETNTASSRRAAVPAMGGG